VRQTEMGATKHRPTIGRISEAGVGLVIDAIDRPDPVSHSV